MPNGRPGDNPLTDFRRHGLEPFAPEVARLLRRIEWLGTQAGRDPLGRHWPFSPREFDWERGRGIEEALHVLTDLIVRFERGRADEVLIDPTTGKPLSAGPNPPASGS